MRLRILRRHINKAIEDHMLGSKSLAYYCPIWQAMHEKFPKETIRVYSSYIVFDTTDKFDLSQDSFKIIKSYTTDWPTLKPQTITLKEIK